MATYSCLPAASSFLAPVSHMGSTQGSNTGEGRSAHLLSRAKLQRKQCHSPKTQENARGVRKQDHRTGAIRLSKTQHH